MDRRSFAKMLTSGVLVAPAVAAMPAPRFTNRKRSYGRFDYQADPILMDPVELWETQYGLCLLNGVEIKSCCYANTATGIIRTYDVLRDGSAAVATVRKLGKFDSDGPRNVVIADVSDHTDNRKWRKKIATLLEPDPRPIEWWKPEDFPGRDVSCPIDGVLCETLHGEVEIWGPEL